MVLVMTVHPGFGGQSFIAEAAEKIRQVRELVGPEVRVEVDGGIDTDTAGLVVSCGADTLVAGSGIFGKEDRIGAIEAIRAAFA
jgi:ribulose-phosphate 3-epimerase